MNPRASLAATRPDRSAHTSPVRGGPSSLRSSSWIRISGALIARPGHRPATYTYPIVGPAPSYPPAGEADSSIVGLERCQRVGPRSASASAACDNDSNRSRRGRPSARFSAVFQRHRSTSWESALTWSMSLGPPRPRRPRPSAAHIPLFATLFDHAIPVICPNFPMFQGYHPMEMPGLQSAVSDGSWAPVPHRRRALRTGARSNPARKAPDLAAVSGKDRLPVLNAARHHERPPAPRRARWTPVTSYPKASSTERERAQPCCAAQTSASTHARRRVMSLAVCRVQAPRPRLEECRRHTDKKIPARCPWWIRAALGMISIPRTSCRRAHNRQTTIA